jgi:glycyl-tRNA synthetase alpha subunit
VDNLLWAFEEDGEARGETLDVRLGAAQGRLATFIRKVSGDAVQYTMGLVKSPSRRPTWSRWGRG